MFSECSIDDGFAQLESIMKVHHPAEIVLCISLICPLILGLYQLPGYLTTSNAPQIILQEAQDSLQKLRRPGMATPPSKFSDGGGVPDPAEKDPASNLIVSDILSKTRKVNIFASLTRDIEPISTRLTDKNETTIVLAPLNSAILSLPRKPWEDPTDYERFGNVDAYKGQDGENRARHNLRRFVEAHLVPVGSWKEGGEVETIGGGRLSWINDGGKIFVSLHLPLLLIDPTSF
jgi:hypothetical protein